MDDLYASAGPKAADACQVSRQFFRSDYGRAERLLFDQIHRHASKGKMVIYVAAAVDSGGRGDPHALGTEYYARRRSAAIQALWQAETSCRGSFRLAAFCGAISMMSMVNRSLS